MVGRAISNGMRRLSALFQLRPIAPTGRAEARWRSATLACLSVASQTFLGCGKGPKHLSLSEYSNGKASFQLLERYEASARLPDLSVDSSYAYSSAATTLIKDIDNGAPNSALRKALSDYDDSVGLLIGARVELRFAKVQEELAGMANGDAFEKARDSEKVAARRTDFEEVEPIVLLCHEDAAQFFDAGAAATGTCPLRISEFKKKHPVGQP